jgi:tripartite-type tricarboxylate transporter receptor subunit TctC
MKLPRRRQFLQLAAGAATLPALSRIARAQAYPTRPVTLIVFVPAGGVPDITARLIGQSLSQRIGQAVVIDNRPGAGGNLALQTVARAEADGYTLLLVGTHTPSTPPSMPSSMSMSLEILHRLPVSVTVRLSWW